MDQYERERIVGRGAYGTVYLCRNKKDSRPVIIKQIPMEQMSAADRQATINEVKVLAMLRHPNIIEYHDSFLHERAMMIVMEYAAGGTLCDLVEAKASDGLYLDETEEIAYLFAQIVLPMHLIHSHNILHRDLKSQNIFLTSTKDFVKIGDFGISKILSSKSKAYTVVGTPSYISPELCEGRPYNQKSDIWSLGCILYEMCALKRAFEAPTLPALVLKIMRGLYQPLPSHFSPALKDLVSSMLELDPGRRPTLAAVMAHPWLAPHLYRLPTTLGALPCTAKPPRPLSRSEDLDMIGRESPYLRRRTPSPFQSAGFDHVTVVIKLATKGHQGQTIRALPPPEKDAIVQIASSADTDIYGVTASGKVLNWPQHSQQTDLKRPPRLLDNFVGIAIKLVAAAPNAHLVLMLTDRGILMTKGRGSDGCLGHDNLESIKRPKIVEALLGEEVTSVACSDRHVVVATSENEVFSWGRNEDGCLGLDGLGEAKNQEQSTQPLVISSPQKVAQLARNRDKDKAKGSKKKTDNSIVIKKVVCGHKCTVLLNSDGEMFVAGRNTSSRLAFARDITGAPFGSFSKCDGVSNVDDVAFGAYHSVVLSNQRTVITQYGPNEGQKTLIELDEGRRQGQISGGSDKNNGAEINSATIVVNHIATSCNKEKANFAVVATSEAKVYLWNVDEPEPEVVNVNLCEAITDGDNTKSPTNVISLNAGKQQLVSTYSK